jgi:uncharacterized protein
MLSPVEKVERIYEAFYAGDLDGAMTYSSTEATIDTDPRLPWGGHYVGREGAAEFALKLAGTTEAVVTAGAIFQAGDRVIQCCRSAGRVRATGIEFDIPECHVWVFRDGIVTGVEFYIDSESILEALGQAAAS